LKAVQIGLGGLKSGIGGVERYYFSLMQSLPAAGTQIRGLVLGDMREADGISCYATEDQPLLTRWAALRSALAEATHESDLIVAHFALYAFGVLDRIKKTPFVIHFHGPWALESAANGSGNITVAAKRALEFMVYRKGSRFIVLSQSFATILARQYHVPRERIHVIPGGVDIDRFRHTGTRLGARRSLNWPEGRPTLVTVRRLVRAKGLENLIAAIQIVKRDIPDILLMIVGTGPLEAELKQQVRQSGLENTVQFAGYASEDSLASVYRAGDLFIVPTLTLEGFGLVVIEALACGTPVLVTPVGGLPEVVSALEPGLVMRSVQPVDVARSITDALLGRIPVPSENACRAYAEQFHWPVIASRINDVYRAAL
jgi:glycosyltransferase involved in cell wall biosynthesis